VAVAYKSAGAGAQVGSSGAALNVPYPATVDAGDILIIQKSIGNITTESDVPSGWELLIGPNRVGTGQRRSSLYGKIAAGGEGGTTQNAGTEATANNRAGRMYSFSGRVSGAILELVGGFSADTDNRTAVTMPTVMTPVDGCLACAFWSSADDNTIGESAGELGGDWTEAVAEYTTTTGTGTDGTLKLSIAPLSSPGTMSGGIATAGAADPYITQGLFISPVPWA
jgi:hypothetical protein